MCGIAGFIGRGSFSDLKKMTDTISHRGPDAEGHWSDDERAIFLGHRRLSILDLEGGVQPMFSVDKRFVIVFNGEIYNHLELREILEKKGHKFQTDHSDTEVLINGYREWGSELSHKLNGMWAFAIYDREMGTLFCSRDRFGQKPFFYTRDKNLFVFGSELKAVTAHAEVNPELSKTALKKYFAYAYIPAPYSAYENVFKLPAGHSLTFNMKNGKFKIEKYWDFVIEPFEKIPKNPEEEWGEEIRDLLSKAVKRRLMSDVPLGIFLSGGVDSSAIAALAAKYAGKEPPKTFSIGFEEAAFDETEYAVQVAENLGTSHEINKLFLSSTNELIPEIIGRLDEPMGDASLLPTYLLSKHTKRHVTVALGGDAGDELFAGYDPFRALKMASIYSKVMPKPLHEGVRWLFSHLPVSHSYMSFDFKVKRTLSGLSHKAKLWAPVWMSTQLPGEIAELFNEEIDVEELFSEAITYWDECPGKNSVDKLLHFYTKLYLQDDILVKGDRASMMHSLEVRAPFLDIDLVNFVRKIPAEWKYRNGTTKYLLKKALEPLIPTDIIYRKKKGFGVPVGKWFREKAITIAASETEKLPLSGSFISKQIREHQAGKVDHRLFLWNLKVLGLWYDKQ